MLLDCAHIDLRFLLFTTRFAAKVKYRPNKSFKATLKMSRECVVLFSRSLMLTAKVGCYWIQMLPTFQMNKPYCYWRIRL